MDATTAVMLVVVFAAVAVAVGTALWTVTDPQETHRRLSQVTAVGGSVTMQAESVISGITNPTVTRARSFVPKSPAAMNRVQRQLAAAGYHSDWGAVVYAVAEMALPALVLIGGILMFGRSTSTLVFSALAAGATHFIPTFWLGRKIEQRRTQIRNGLPDAIDLLIVCIESGAGIDQSLLRVGEELVIAYPALSREFELICAEMRAGKARMEAFKNFAERTKVDDVRQLVAMLVQTDRFGTSLGQALRTHAETSRTKRRQRAEEKAAKLGIKLLFPLVFCLFPAFYLVVLGPSILRIFRELVWGPMAP